MSNQTNVKKWIRELKAAGWIMHRNDPDFWICPKTKKIYSGPYLAWRTMKQREGAK